jgi:hypothetical protein
MAEGAREERGGQAVVGAGRTVGDRVGLAVRR